MGTAVAGIKHDFNLGRTNPVESGHGGDDFDFNSTGRGGSLMQRWFVRGLVDSEK